MKNPILDFHYVFRTFCKKFDQNRANMTVAAAQRKQCHVQASPQSQLIPTESRVQQCTNSKQTCLTRYDAYVIDLSYTSCFKAVQNTGSQQNCRLYHVSQSCKMERPGVVFSVFLVALIGTLQTTMAFDDGLAEISFSVLVFVSSFIIGICALQIHILCINSMIFTLAPLFIIIIKSQILCKTSCSTRRDTWLRFWQSWQDVSLLSLHSTRLQPLIKS